MTNVGRSVEDKQKTRQVIINAELGSRSLMQLDSFNIFVKIATMAKAMLTLTLGQN